MASTKVAPTYPASESANGRGEPMCSPCIRVHPICAAVFAVASSVKGRHIGLPLRMPKNVSVNGRGEPVCSPNIYVFALYPVFAVYPFRPICAAVFAVTSRADTQVCPYRKSISIINYLWQQKHLSIIRRYITANLYG